MTSMVKFTDRTKRGEEVVYHKGVLAIDRLVSPEIDAVADGAMNLYVSGHADLYQRKLGKNKYEYVIRRRKTDAGKRPFTGCYAGD